MIPRSCANAAAARQRPIPPQYDPVRIITRRGTRGKGKRASAASVRAGAFTSGAAIHSGFKANSTIPPPTPHLTSPNILSFTLVHPPYSVLSHNTQTRPAFSLLSISTHPGFPLRVIHAFPLFDSCHLREVHSGAEAVPEVRPSGWWRGRMLLIRCRAQAHITDSALHSTRPYSNSRLPYPK
jgi:hypothetical protein